MAERQQDRDVTYAWSSLLTVIAAAARRRLAACGLRQVVAEWEREHGVLADDEIADTRRRLGW